MTRCPCSIPNHPVEQTAVSPVAEVVPDGREGWDPKSPILHPGLTRLPNPPQGNPLELWDSNGNGRIGCAEAQEHGTAPVHSDHPAYQFMRDANADGVVCE